MPRAEAKRPGGASRRGAGRESFDAGSRLVRADQYWSAEMTSPPLRVTRPRRVDEVDRVLDEPDAAVAEEAVDAAGVEREELVVGAGVVAGGAEVPGSVV